MIYFSSSSYAALVLFNAFCSPVFCLGYACVLSLSVCVYANACVLSLSVCVYANACVLSLSVCVCVYACVYVCMCLVLGT